MNTLTAALRAFRRWLRLRDAWTLAQRTLWMAPAVGVVILGLGSVVPISNLAAWSLAPGLIWLCATIGYSLLRPMPLPRVARRVDSELNLKERLGTAVELANQGQPHPPGGSSAPSAQRALPGYQYADALAAARAVDPRRDLPLRAHPRPLLAAAVWLAAALLLLYLPNPMDAVLAERAAVKQAAEAEAERIEKTAEQLAESDLSPEKQAELLRQMEELARQLRANPGDRAQALADLSALEAELRRQIDPNYGRQQTMLDALSTQLQSLAADENVRPPNADAALEQLADSLEALSAEERQALAAALSQMAAQAAQAGDPALAQALAAMSQAAQNGEAGAASQAAEQVSGAMQATRQSLADQQMLQQTLNQLQQSSQSIAQAGKPGQGTQQTASAGSGQPPGQGQNQGQGQGQSAGRGQGGQGMSGGGTNADTLPPGTGRGQAGNPENRNTGAALGDPSEQVFVPWERQSTAGETVTLPGQDTGQGVTISRENPNPLGGLSNPALIPYQQVYAQYFSAAQQAISGGDIPPAYRDLVREYFVQLEP